MPDLALGINIIPHTHALMPALDCSGLASQGDESFIGCGPLDAILRRSPTQPPFGSPPLDSVQRHSSICYSPILHETRLLVLLCESFDTVNFCRLVLSLRSSDSLREPVLAVTFFAELPWCSSMSRRITQHINTSHAVALCRLLSSTPIQRADTSFHSHPLLYIQLPAMHCEQ